MPRNRLRAGGCAIVTASHNAAEWNGLKWLVGDMPPGPEEVERLRSESDAAGGRPSQPAGGQPPRRWTSPSTTSPGFRSDGWTPCGRAEHIVLGSDARLLVGPGEAVSQRDLSRVSPFGDSRLERPDFDGRCPDCSQPDQLHDLCEAVYRGRADLGLAFDGDGDRLAVVDNEGVALTGEETAWILLQAMGPKLKGDRFVYDVKFSDRIREAAAALGAEPLVERSGHAFLRARMARADALFGAELTGHYFFRELAHGDDSLLAACMLIAYLAESRRDAGRSAAGVPGRLHHARSARFRQWQRPRRVDRRGCGGRGRSIRRRRSTACASKCPAVGPWCESR